MSNKNDRRLHSLLCMTQLPKQVIQHSERYNVAEFILHSLSHPECFNLSKAAYFVDNPDFNYLQGLVGYHEQEAYKENHWEKPDLFSQYMQEKKFNKLVKSLALPSIKKNQKLHTDIGQELAYTLEIHEPNFLLWPLKYDNFGLLIFESATPLDQEDKEQLELGANLLGFCPVF